MACALRRDGVTDSGFNYVQLCTPCLGWRLHLSFQSTYNNSRL
ncbi:MAG: hypothetical protein P8X74_23175 [Reinekea sp.]